jgi:anthranilate synthase component 2
MIVLIDNKDSFVWNLADYASAFDEIAVVGNGITPSELRAYRPDGIIISPGPGTPSSRRYVGNVPDILETAESPILGVCLGHQAIAHTFGGTVGRVSPVHGKESVISHDGKAIYEGIPNPLRAARYHSLAVLRAPDGFDVTARSEDGTIMGIRNAGLSIEGVQFHPESVLTGYETGDGLRIIKNFVAACMGAP